MIEEGLKKCPRCKLVNLPSAKYCDCGYEFTSTVMDEHKAHFFDKERRRKGLYVIIWGIGSIIVGLILTFASYKLSAVLKWGIYVFFAGFVYAGLYLIYRGVILIIGERK